MAKQKAKGANRALGTVTKKLDSGLFVTDKGEKIPALHGLKIGDKVSLEGSAYVVNGGKDDATEKKEAAGLGEVNEKFAAIEKELEAMKTENAAMKKELEAMKTEKPGTPPAGE